MPVHCQASLVLLVLHVTLDSAILQMRAQLCEQYMLKTYSQHRRSENVIYYRRLAWHSVPDALLSCVAKHYLHLRSSLIQDGSAFAGCRGVCLPLHTLSGVTMCWTYHI